MNMNILFMFVFTTYSNGTSMCRFRFGPKTPEHELNRTVASLAILLIYTRGIIIDSSQGVGPGRDRQQCNVEVCDRLEFITPMMTGWLMRTFKKQFNIIIYQYIKYWRLTSSMTPSWPTNAPPRVSTWTLGCTGWSNCRGRQGRRLRSNCRSGWGRRLRSSGQWRGGRWQCKGISATKKLRAKASMAWYFWRSVATPLKITG